MKTKKCKICNNKFQPTRQLQPTCTNPKCIREYQSIHLKKVVMKTKNQEKNFGFKKSTKRIKEKSDKGVLLDLAQKVFNQYIRTRDEYETCISCYGKHHNYTYHAGHYLSRGARPHLRFNTDNCHKQCSYCNVNLSGNQKEYQKNLIRKIGKARVMRLENNREYKNFSDEYLHKLIRVFKKKTRRLK